MQVRKIVRHGEAAHGRVTKEYRTWDSMLRRCYDKKFVPYLSYGARGISVCDRWRVSYLDFLEDMGRAPSEGHSIDRIDGSCGYSPENCRWATKKEQARNRRDNVYLTIAGEKMILKDVAAKFGIEYNNFLSRLKRGWPLLEALGLKPRQRENWGTNIPKFPKLEIPRLLAMRSAGCTYREIGETFNISRSRAHQIVRDTSIPLDMTNGQSLVDAMDAVKAIKDHLPAGTVVEVAAGMGKL